MQSDDDDVIESALTEVCKKHKHKKKMKMQKPKKRKATETEPKRQVCVCVEVADAVWCSLLHLLLICNDMHGAVFPENSAGSGKANATKVQ